MGKGIRIFMGAVIVLALALFLVTARQKHSHQPALTGPAVTP
jgi:hypothetical protein